MSIFPKRRRFLGERSLTLAERALVAVTACLAVASVALAVAGSARASGPVGVLLADGPFIAEPLRTASHTQATPAAGMPAPTVVDAALEPTPWAAGGQ